MKRDFTEATKNELIALVKEVEDEKWCDFTDWIGDRWFDFEAWIGALDIKQYVDNMNEYHKKVIDKNNTTVAEIEKIFNDVYAVNDNYTTRFSALFLTLKEYKRTLDLTASAIEPGKGNFNAQYIGGTLENAVSEYLITKNVMSEIAGDGLTQEEIQNMDQSVLQSILDKYKTVIIDNVPDIKVGETVEIPIGPGVNIYYKVSGTLNGTGDAEINAAIKDQQLQLKSIGYNVGDIGNISIDSNGELSAAINGENVPTITYSASGVSVVYSSEAGANTYSYKYAIDVIKQEFLLEESIKTAIGEGSVSSAIGIKFTQENHWKPIPEPVPVTSPYTSKLPSFEVDWETVAVVATVVVVAVVVVGAILLAPETGGASLVVLAVV